MLRKVSICLILFTILILYLTSCSTNNEYSGSVSSFKEIYFKTTDSIVPSDILTSLKNLQGEENEKNIEKLKQLLDEIKEKASENNQDEYVQLSNWYDGLAYLHDAYKNWGNLTFEEKEKIFNEIVLIQNRRHKR